MKTKLEQTLALIHDLRNERAVKIVEGKKDTRALTTLGISNLREIHKGQDLADFVHSIKGKKVIILTDYDRKGGQLKRKLKEMLVSEGKTVNTDYRRKLRYLTGVKYIENLHRLIRKMKEETK